MTTHCLWLIFALLERLAPPYAIPMPKMQSADAHTLIQQAITRIEQARSQPTDGKWLEEITVKVGPYIKDWDISHCYSWADYSKLSDDADNLSQQDTGIDCVAVRRGDGERIAIQCKARRIDQSGESTPIQKGELDSFGHATSNSRYKERWLVTNGEAKFSPQAEKTLSMADADYPIKPVNIYADLKSQQAVQEATEGDPAPHDQSDAEQATRQTRQCMQEEAVNTAVGTLREHAKSASGGLPVGQARGKIILPCGAGKTRVSLRIVERLTPIGGVAVVLCPSIALVAQIRREYLQHATESINALAVCSDETAGYDPKKEEKRNTKDDPTADCSNISASAVKGQVTTDPQEITEWIKRVKQGQDIGVIFGTYQSAHRVAKALRDTATTAAVLIGDEAHRTAGLRKKKTDKLDENLRNFTLCHDNDAFPVTYRIYQTATPRVYDPDRVRRRNQEWVVRSMDDETVFGVELYRRSYVDAVRNGWLSDYRIIAIGINDPQAYEAANLLARNTGSKGRQALTTDHYIRGLAFALAMGNATGRDDDKERQVAIQSCIAFMNTVDKSKNMARDLQSDTVRQWIQKYLDDNRPGRQVARYQLEHLDAGSNVLQREQAKSKLAQGSKQQPHGVLNVGIFGEGTDSPSLSAVAFLEPRKSPIDVIQAVGRAMRAAPDKEVGYIICPIVIPPRADPEQWLRTSSQEDGWQELGQILLALRAHDERIEDQLADLITLYIPPAQEMVATIVATASQGAGQIEEHIHVGARGEAQKAAEQVVEDKACPRDVGLRPLSYLEEVQELTADHPANQESGRPSTSVNLTLENITPWDPHTIQTTHQTADGSLETREHRVIRHKPTLPATLGPIDFKKTRDKAKAMINDGAGERKPHSSQQKPRKTTDRGDRNARQMLLLTGLDENTRAIRMNLLTRSGLKGDRVNRDLNILESSINEAARHLQNDNLQPALDRHFGIDNLKEDNRKKQADGCTIAALLLMNAAMLHQRIANGGWLSGISDLSAVKRDTNVVRMALRQWNAIIAHDFKPVMEPAVRAIEAIEDTGRLAGLERALHHLAAEAEQIAETYADMGADHAGPLFNRVMGNQASDGAYFTRPIAASIAARLTLDACGEPDWTDPEVWRQYRTVDLACGSGTLLAAMLTDMKRRAREQGASEERIVELQKLAVEETIKGLDINPVSLQLAASQLTAGNTDIRYRRMGLYQMPYGPHPHNQRQVSVGTLELLAQQAIVPRQGQQRDLGPDGNKIASQAVWNQQDDAELEDAVDAVKDARIVIMNPPFSNRSKMGEKFTGEKQKALRERTDSLEDVLIALDPELKNFGSRNTVRPCFVALADRCLPEDTGVLTMINPTIALTAPSGLNERRILAHRYHIHTVLTCHQPGNINLSQNTNINESIVVAVRHSSAKNTPPPPPPHLYESSPTHTRFINLDRLPVDDTEVADLHQCLSKRRVGPIPNGWGVVSEWPAKHMRVGDWTPAIWRSAELAEAARKFAGYTPMRTIREHGYNCWKTSALSKDQFISASSNEMGSFPIIDSKGADGQKTIRSAPDAHWQPTNPDEMQRIANGGTYPEVDRLLMKAGNLLVTSGQDTSTARLSAIADDNKYVGRGFLPVTGPIIQEAKAIAVFINSTAGRLQLLRNAGRKLAFPLYNPKPIENLRIPDIKDTRIRQILADCWERTKDMTVPQFRDGECQVRRLWDEAVAQAMGWDANELARLRNLLHREPHVRGLGYGQYATAKDDPEPAPITTPPLRGSRRSRAEGEG